MTVILYDLSGASGRSFSPNCWRVRMALAHKELDYEIRPTLFTEISRIADGKRTMVPTIADGEVLVSDSWEIAHYLESQYPNRPSLFRNAEGAAFARFMNRWVSTVMHGNVGGFVMKDIHDHLDPKDQDYFRQSREQRFKRTLEEIQAGREQRLEPFSASLTPLRDLLDQSPFFAGDGPHYVDYLVFGALQWARTISQFRLLPDEDPLAAWMNRCLDLHGGIGRREPGYYWT